MESNIQNIRTHCCCGIVLNEAWHDANGWTSRIHYAYAQIWYGPSEKPQKLRTPETCNACHCPHHDCIKASCEEYHNG